MGYNMYGHSVLNTINYDNTVPILSYDSSKWVRGTNLLYNGIGTESSEKSMMYDAYINILGASKFVLTNKTNGDAFFTFNSYDKNKNGLKHGRTLVPGNSSVTIDISTYQFGEKALFVRFSFSQFSSSYTESDIVMEVI